MPRSLLLCPLLAALLATPCVHAASSRAWTGVVTSVVDGDTVWVKRSRAAKTDEGVDIRIEGIDAPESCQTYGPTAKEALAKLILRQKVRVTAHRTDQYGRTVARLAIGPDDVGDWMVRHGHAWSYHYRGDKGPYAAQEAVAQSLGRGLFATPGAEQPHEFRQRHGSCHVK
jgi:micrococcal nuclease